MVELAERKFLRHLINYANDLVPFPRLVTIDLLSVEDMMKHEESHTVSMLMDLKPFSYLVNTTV